MFQLYVKGTQGPVIGKPGANKVGKGSFLKRIAECFYQMAEEGVLGTREHQMSLWRRVQWAKRKE